MYTVVKTFNNPWMGAKQVLNKTVNWGKVFFWSFLFKINPVGPLVTFPGCYHHYRLCGHLWEINSLNNQVLSLPFLVLFLQEVNIFMFSIDIQSVSSKYYNFFVFLFYWWMKIIPTGIFWIIRWPIIYHFICKLV